MCIFKPAAPAPIGIYAFTIQQLEFSLDANSASTLRHLLYVLNAPVDIPRFTSVLKVAVEAVAAYGATLANPSKKFHLVQESLSKLVDDVTVATSAVSDNHELDRPLLRRLSDFGAYALCLTLRFSTLITVNNAREVIGLEIALGIALGLKVDNGFATDIRRTLTPELFGVQKKASKRDLDWLKAYSKRRIKAAKQFETGDDPDPESQGKLRLFDVAAGFELSRKMRFAPPRQRQALLDRHHQTYWQIKSSAAALMTRANHHDHSALLILVAYSSGLTLRLTKDIPLANRVFDDCWFMVLDVEAGVIKIKLDRLFPAAAVPKPGAECFRPANRVIVKPLPQFLWQILKELHAQLPEAETLAQLIPEALTSGRQLTLADDTSALAPSAKRFLIAGAPFCVGIGIDRLVAAILASDFSVIPSSKMYYCRVRPDEIWAASGTLFSGLGWGAPAPFLPGPAVGSQIVPSRAALAAWWAWMVDQVVGSVPGRHCGFARLSNFHSNFAKLNASFAILCLAAREAKQLKFTTHNLQPECSFAAFVHKLVGIIPGEVKVPINALLKAQLRLWFGHCRALLRRIEKETDPASRKLACVLRSYLRSNSHPLFFTICPESGLTLPLGSAALMDWWPQEYCFSGDLGRHLWEVELRDAGVRSTRIDVLLRHITLGTEAHCSTNADKLADVAAEITAAQEFLLESIGVRPVPGLVTRV